MCTKMSNTAGDQDLICKRLRRIASDAEGLKASLPTLPLKNWFDGTIQNPDVEVFFEKYDLAKLLQFIADVGLE